MKKNLILSLVFSSCAQLKNPSPREIEIHCQDLNVLYQKISAITSNIVNINTTRTVEGGHYKRKIAKNCKHGICEIVNDETPPILKYEPKSPDADKNGYVAYPNISIESEKAHELYWSRVFEAVIANSPVPANFFFKDQRAKDCFDKYPKLKENKDYFEYLGRDTGPLP
jgi:flagellar basal-body rod protein FlgC